MAKHVLHWHAGSNMTGYLPTGDVGVYETEDDALDEQANIIESYLEDNADIEEADDQWVVDYMDDETEIETRELLVNYLKTHPLVYVDRRHDAYSIPIAVWRNECSEFECADEDDEAEDADVVLLSAGAYQEMVEDYLYRSAAFNGYDPKWD